jgi:hypothetical protein
MFIYTPYFYIIQDIRNGMYYAGVRWNKECHPSELLMKNGYHTSSNRVKNILSEQGLDSFKIRKIKIFTTAIEAQEYEIRFLKKVDAMNNPRFYNGHNGENLMSYGTDKYYEYMKDTYGVKTPLQSEYLRQVQSNNNIKKYGVANVFAREDIKEKIKQTNIERYGVEHPSKSGQLLKKKSDNFMKKYGVSYNLHMPDVKIKAATALKSPEVIEKRNRTFLERYGVTNAGQLQSTKDKVLEIRSKLSERLIVLKIRQYSKIFNIILGKGWYQSSDEKLQVILNNLEKQYGII